MWCNRSDEVEVWLTNNKWRGALVGNAIPGVRYVLPYGSRVYAVYKLDDRYPNRCENRVNIVVIDDHVTGIIRDTDRLYDESYFLSWFPNLQWHRMS